VPLSELYETEEDQHNRICHKFITQQISTNYAANFICDLPSETVSETQYKRKKKFCNNAELSEQASFSVDLSIVFLTFLFQTLSE